MAVTCFSWTVSVFCERRPIKTHVPFLRVPRMAASRFVNVSDEDISQFLEDNENKNTARETSRDLAWLFKTSVQGDFKRTIRVTFLSYIHTLLLNVICNKQIITC